LFQHDHPIAQAFDLRHIMRSKQDRTVEVAPMGLEVGAHPIRRVRIERGCRLVEQQQFGIVDQCLGESHARFLSRREAPARTIEKLDKREILGEPRDFPLYVAGAIEPREDAQILPNGKAMRHVHVRALEIHAAEHTVAVMRHVVTEHADRAARRLDQAHDHPDSRRFASAVATKQPRRRTRNERERERPDSDGFVIGLAEAFDDEGDVRRRKVAGHARTYYQAYRCGKRRPLDCEHLEADIAPIRRFWQCQCSATWAAIFLKLAKARNENRDAVEKLLLNTVSAGNQIRAYHREFVPGECAQVADR
jgi:hypothetical protein